MQALTLKADEVKFERSFFAFAYPFVKFPKPLPVFRRNKAVYAVADYIAGGKRADHGQPGRIHVKQRSVGGNHLHALGSRLHDGAKLFLGDELFVFALRDVDEQVDATDDFTCGIPQNGRVRSKPKARAIGPLGNALDTAGRLAAFERDCHRALVVGQRCAVGQEYLPGDAPTVRAELGQTARKSHSRGVEIR